MDAATLTRFQTEWAASVDPERGDGFDVSPGAVAAAVTLMRAQFDDTGFDTATEAAEWFADAYDVIADDDAATIPEWVFEAALHVVDENGNGVDEDGEWAADDRDLDDDCEDDTTVYPGDIGDNEDAGDGRAMNAADATEFMDDRGVQRAPVDDEPEFNDYVSDRDLARGEE